MKKLILLVVLYNLQNSDSSGQTKSTDDCQNVVGVFVKCMFTSRHVERHMEHSVCPEAQNHLNVSLYTKIDNLNKELELLHQRYNATTTQLEHTKLKENETQLRLKLMQEKEGELNNTLATCHKEMLETKNRQAAIENLITSTVSSIKETVKYHSDLNFKLIENTTSSNTDKFNLLLQRDNDSTTKLENKIRKRLETQLNLTRESETKLNNTLQSCQTEISEAKTSLRAIGNLINTLKRRLEETEKFNSDLNPRTIQNANVDNADSTITIIHALSDTIVRMLQLETKKAMTRENVPELSLKFKEKEREFKNTLALYKTEISETKNRLQALENLKTTSVRKVQETVKFLIGLRSFLIQNTRSADLASVVSQLNQMDLKMKEMLHAIQFPSISTVRLSTGTYLYVNVLKSWSDARKYCQDVGMDLVAIETSAEDEALLQFISSTEEYAHTSGCYSSASNSFVWRSTGQEVSYTNWYQGYPTASSDSQCIQISPTTNNWLHDSDKQTFICEL